MPDQDPTLDRLREAVKGEYDVLAKLGQGGMATVYLARQLALDREVAIKVMAPELLLGNDAVERFVREARTAASLGHRNIISIFDVRQQGDLLYFVMEYVRGRPLDSIIREVGPLPINMAQSILSEIGRALAHAHRRGVVHRDIKPANIMINEDGHAVVTDFGIAKVFAAKGLTATGATIGTPTYMSPEQCQDFEVTGQSDQYSLGIVAYEMFSGQVPFDAPSAMGLMWAHVNDPPPPLRDVRLDCPAELETTIMRMLAKAAEDRWPGVEQAVESMMRVPVSGSQPVRTELMTLARSWADRPVLDMYSAPTTPMSPPVLPPVHEAQAKPGLRGKWLGPGIPAAALAAGAIWVGMGGLKSDGGPEGTPVPLASITLTPQTSTLSLNEQASLVAELRDADGTLTDGDVVWSTSDSTNAIVDSTGLVTAVGVGTVQITAVSGAFSNVASITVTARALAVRSVALMPSDTTVHVSSRFTLATDVKGEDGVALLGRSLVWRSSNPAVATIDSLTGVASAHSPGDVRITASVDGITGAATIQIVEVRAAIASIRVPNPSMVLEVGDTSLLVATPIDRDGNAVAGSAVRWESRNPAVAQLIPGPARIIGIRDGDAVVTATVENQTIDMDVHVQRSAATVAIAATDTAWPVGASFTLGAMVQDRFGATLDRSVSWMSTDSAVASVSSNGTVAARQLGNASIVAMIDAVTDTLRLTVGAAAATSLSGLTFVTAGGRSSCGIVSDGNGFCWGGESADAMQIPSLTFQQLAVGDGHTCGLTPTGDAHCWGENSQGQLGDGSSNSRATAVRVVARQSFAYLTTGASHTCALTADGAAFCWGSNREGQLGDGSKSERRTPAQVRGEQSFRSLSAGGQHTCGVTQDSRAFCWGDGFSGQIGSGQRHNADEPFGVRGDLSFSKVAVGSLHSCGLTTNGRIYCWGDNDDGQLGNDTRDERYQPDSVYTDVPFRDLTSGDRHACGIVGNGQVYCWGRNQNGQLGDGTRSRRVAPVLAAGGQAFETISAGVSHTCGFTTDGHALCWGANNRGQLGTGSTSERVLRPAEVTVVPGNSP